MTDLPADTTDAGLDRDWADGWIMLSIARFPEGASLRDVIAAADMFNHAIPTHDEVEGAIARLGQGGWIVRDEDRYLMTEAVPDSARLWPAEFVWSAGELGKKLPPRAERNEEWTIDVAEFEAAKVTYHASMRERRADS